MLPCLNRQRSCWPKAGLLIQKLDCGGEISKASEVARQREVWVSNLRVSCERRRKKAAGQCARQRGPVAVQKLVKEVNSFRTNGKSLVVHQESENQS